MNNATNYVIVGILAVLLLGGLGSFLYFGGVLNLAVGFDSQCSLPSCQSGYSDKGVICGDKECTRVCIKQVDTKCGSFKQLNPI